MLVLQLVSQILVKFTTVVFNVKFRLISRLCLNVSLKVHIRTGNQTICSAIWD